jgi:acetyl-CoA carboxylase biotin carboxyl carrier protein
MNIDEIKELIHVVNESGIAELEVQRGDARVRIRRSLGAASPQEFVLSHGAPVVTAGPVAAPSHTYPAAVAAAPVPVNSRPAEPPAKAEEEEKLTLVKSPIVGTFYESPAPGSPPFVRIGDHVQPGQVLCIIESMKLMNEIEAEVAGIIARRLVENGRPVEYGEALFAVKPA